MEVVNTIGVLRALLKPWRKADNIIALVPTMGNLHRGHLSLIEKAQTQGDRVVASIYVNPTQFDRADDLNQYPRTLEEDVRQLESAGVDVLFAPSDDAMYPGGCADKTRIDVPGMTTILDGEHRPGHFVGVATVVCKLFNMVQPDIAVFGEKDFQQLLIVRQMASDLNLPVTIIGAPTWREDNGLAMSSRNGYLNDAEFDQAALIYQVLCDCTTAIKKGKRNYLQLEQQAIEKLDRGGFKTDYIAVRRCTDLLLPLEDDNPDDLVVLAAAFMGKARLIDNIPLKQLLE